MNTNRKTTKISNDSFIAVIYYFLWPNIPILTKITLFKNSRKKIVNKFQVIIFKNWKIRGG